MKPEDCFLNRGNPVARFVADRARAREVSFMMDDMDQKRTK